MILRNTYQEIMEHVEVTPQMRERILENIRHADLTERKPVSFRNYRRFAAAAATLAVLLAAGFVLTPILQNNGQNDRTPDENVQVVWQCEEWNSAKELAKAVGFEVADVKELPFEPEQTTYLSIGEDLAEINYTAGTQGACYRKSAGTEDNSGNYTDFPKVETVNIGAYEVTLKGNDAGYELALWTDGAYAYSLSFAQPQSVEAWSRILEANKE